MADPAPPTDDRPAPLNENIESLLEVRRRELQQRSPQFKFVDRVSEIIGRPAYLVGIVVFTALWVCANGLARRFGWRSFDPAPFALLDGVLTLAALISTTVILIAQNRQTRLEQQHTHIALQVTLLTEQKVAKIISLLEELRRDLPMVKNRYDPHAETLAEKTDALQVLSAIEEVGLSDPPAPADASKKATDHS